MVLPTTKNVRTVTDMRENTLKLLRDAKRSYGPIYIFRRSKPVAVFLDLEEYEKLRDLAEDYLDSLKAEEYEKMDKSKVKWLSLEEVAKEVGVKLR